MPDNARKPRHGTGVPGQSSRPTGVNVAGLAAGDAQTLEALRERVRLAEAAGDTVRAGELAELLARRTSGDWSILTATTSPGSPSPTEDGRMGTMAKAEEHHTEPRRPNTVSRVYPVRIKTKLVDAATAKAAAEEPGLGLNALIDKLLSEYVERSDG